MCPWRGLYFSSVNVVIDKKFFPITEGGYLIIAAIPPLVSFPDPSPWSVEGFLGTRLSYYTMCTTILFSAKFFEALNFREYTKQTPTHLLTYQCTWHLPLRVLLTLFPPSFPPFLPQATKLSLETKLEALTLSGKSFQLLPVEMSSPGGVSPPGEMSPPGVLMGISFIRIQ